MALKGASDARGSSDPVPIAGDHCGGPGASDPISTAARRGNGSHCDDAGCERMTSIRKPSTFTFISSVNASGLCGRLGMTMFRQKKGSGTGLVLVRERFSSISVVVSIHGRSRTLASRSYASRALANNAIALDGASRQAPRLESFF